MIQLLTKPPAGPCDSCGEPASKLIRFRLENKKYEDYSLPDINFCDVCYNDLKEQF